MSTAQVNKHWLGVTRFLFVFALVALFGSSVFSQQMPQGKSPPNPSDSTINSRKSDSDPRFGSPENEIRSKMILKEEKKRYDENLARAREVSELASQLNETFEAKKVFDPDDGKRLERLEKLTKRIRNEAGGSDSEPDPDMKDICARMEDTVKHLADIAEELNKMVEKTPRNVISAAVIDQANRLLLITQHLRTTR